MRAHQRNRKSLFFGASEVSSRSIGSEVLGTVGCCQFDAVHQKPPFRAYSSLLISLLNIVDFLVFGEIIDDVIGIPARCQHVIDQLRGPRYLDRDR